MIVVTATETKNRLGRVLQQAVREPVTIEKSGYPVAVLLSYETYERYQWLEDRYWGERAKEARKRGGYLEGDELQEKIGRHLEES